ncbi:MAG: TetR/AcrR family transcriptional regulator [Acidimicrobiales bacterium]
MNVGPRARVLAAVVTCLGRVGVRRLTVDEVASEAGVSRASVYRWFPGGRDQLVDEAITWEVARYLNRLAEAVAAETTLADRLTRGLLFAHRTIEEHEVLQRLLATEPGGVLPQLRETAPLIVAVMRDWLTPLVASEPALRQGLDPAEAADWLARMIISFTITPGRWDLDDPAQVRELVASELLAGVVHAV